MTMREIMQKTVGDVLLSLCGQWKIFVTDRDIPVIKCRYIDTKNKQKTAQQ